MTLFPVWRKFHLDWFICMLDFCFYLHSSRWLLTTMSFFLRLQSIFNKILKGNVFNIIWITFIDYRYPLLKVGYPNERSFKDIYKHHLWNYVFVCGPLFARINKEDVPTLFSLEYFFDHSVFFLTPLHIHVLKVNG